MERQQDFEDILHTARSYLRQPQVHVHAFPIKPNGLTGFYLGLNGEDPDQAEENERLAFGGDIFYNSCAHDELERRFTGASCSQLAELKDVLTSNDFQAELVAKMGFGQHITTPHYKKRKREPDGRFDKAGGDAFECLVELYRIQAGPDIAGFFLRTILRDVIDVCVDSYRKLKKRHKAAAKRESRRAKQTAKEKMEDKDKDENERPKKKAKPMPTRTLPTRVPVPLVNVGTTTRIPTASSETSSIPRPNFTFTSPFRRRNRSSPPTLIGVSLEAYHDLHTAVSTFQSDHSISYFSTMSSYIKGPLTLFSALSIGGAESLPLQGTQ